MPLAFEHLEHLKLADALSLRSPGRVLAVGAWGERSLPEGGLPRGVVELASPGALGGPTRIAAVAVREAQKADPAGWCAWVDPANTLYGPGLVMAGVTLGRLLVVRPELRDVARVAVKLAQSRVFDVLVVDAGDARALEAGEGRRGWRADVVVRKLALLAEEGGATVLLLTDTHARRALPWPVALRLEITRPKPDELVVRVTKDRRGRAGLARTVPLSAFDPPAAERA